MKAIYKAYIYTAGKGGLGPSSLDLVRGEMLSPLHLQSSLRTFAFGRWRYDPLTEHFDPPERTEPRKS